MDKIDRQLLEEINKLLKQLETLIYNNYLAAMNLFQVKKSLSGDNPFWFSRNAAADRQMNELISNFNKQTNALFMNGIERSWKLGEKSAIDKIRLAFSGNARQQKAFDQIRTEATQRQRNQGSQASAKRYAEGINLSERVWKLRNGMKQEIETIIQNGMKEGKSADRLSKELNKYLNEPDKLFRKVRNKETGELELSDAAKKYKPGQGVYRSAYKNVMRLARTEIAAAYRRAAWEKYQNDPRIIGIRISLSNNHTCINPQTGKPEPFFDICDELQGDYPKSFLWTGWHPQCRCIMNPIVISGDEATKFIDAKVKGEKYEPKQITEPPRALNEWIERNRERAKGWDSMPYWIKDNRKFIKDFEVNTYTPQEYTFTHAQKTALAMNRAIKELSLLYPNIPNTNLAAIHHYTKAGGNYRQLNKQLDNGTLTSFNAASATLIQKGLEQLPVIKGTVYRGMIIKQKEFNRIFGGEIGSTVKQNRFISSSTDVDIAFDFATRNQNTMKKTEIQVIFEINSKNGRDISKISELNGIFALRNQHEVLFTNNTIFRIDSKKVTDKTFWIKLTEL
ncbi:MAG: hypothetical protein LBJ63_07885 [Prevotellaceae bacterium]|jgi:hypothetical protein|nr:hypothetical protein [Prevotellaceae bacterium]